MFQIKTENFRHIKSTEMNAFMSVKSIPVTSSIKKISMDVINEVACYAKQLPIQAVIKNGHLNNKNL